MISRRHLTVVLAVSLICAGAARADVGPSRATVPLSGGAVIPKVFTPPVNGAVALPSGGALFLLNGPTGIPQLVQVTAHGLPDPAFGVSGSLNAQWPSALNLGPMLRAPDGKLLVIGTAAAAHNDELPQRVVVRLNPDGTVDGTYGTYGVARPPLQINCSCPEPAFMLGDGSVVLAASSGRSVGRNAWVVAKLTPTGQLDPAFGSGGLTTVGSVGSGGDDVVPGAGGTIVTLGSAPRAPLAARGRNLLVARLNADGSPDPTFAGGEPLALPADAGAGDLAVRADGGVVVSDFGHVTTIGADGAASAAHVRVGPTSALTPLLNTAGGVVLVRVDGTHIAALGADGTVGPPVTLDPGFGGFVGNTPPLRERLSPLPRATYQGALLRLASGAFLGYGTIGLVDRGVAHPATPGHTSIAAIALAGFGPDMLPDPTFGGPPTAAGGGRGARTATGAATRATTASSTSRSPCRRRRPCGSSCGRETR